MKKNIIILIIIVAGAVLRIAGLNFGLPLLHCRPDENLIIFKALGYFSGDFNPHFFAYPSLYSYVLYVLYKCYYALGLMLNFWNSNEAFVTAYTYDRSVIIMISRVFACLLGITTIWIVYKIGLLIRDNTTGIIGAACYAFAYLAIREAHFAVTDTPMTCFVAASVYFCIRTYIDRKLLTYVLAGVFIGIGTGLKYNAIMCLFPLILARYLALFNKKYWFRTALQMLYDKSMWASICAVFITLFLVSPYIYIDYQNFFRDFLGEVHHLSSGHPFGNLMVNFGPGVIRHSMFSLLYGLGVPLLCAAVIGIWFLLIRNFRVALIFLSFPILYFICIGRGYTVFVRYALPLVPFACILGAVFVSGVSGFLSNRFAFNNRKKNALIIAVALCLLVSSICRAMFFDYLLMQRDTRLLLLDWLNKQPIAKCKVCQIGALTLNQVATTKFQPDTDKLKQLINRLEAANEPTNTLTYKTIKSALLREGRIDVNEVRYVDQIDNFIDEWNQIGLPDFIAFYTSPLIYYHRPLTQSLLQTINDKYVKVYSFVSVEFSVSPEQYDQQDAFYIPYYGYSGVYRPGPCITVFARSTMR